MTSSGFDSEVPLRAAYATIVVLVVGISVLLTTLAVVRTPVVVRCTVTVKPGKDVSILRAPRSGYLAEVLVTEGSRVLAGEPVFRIATDELDVLVPHIEAQLESLRRAKEAARELYLARHDSTLAEQKLATRRARVQGNQHARFRRMQQSGVLSQDAVDGSSIGTLDATIAVARARGALNDVLATSKYELAFLDNEIAQLGERLAQIRAEIANARVLAPITGYVHKLELSARQPVAASDVVTWVLPEGSVRADLSVPSSGVGMVTPGQTARIVLANYPRERYDPGVARIDRVWQQMEAKPDSAVPRVIASAILLQGPRDRRGTLQPVEPGMLGHADVILGEERFLTAILRSLVAGSDSVVVR